MSFQNLRTNNQIFILHKGDKPFIEIAQVLNVSAPAPKFQNNIPSYGLTYQQEMIVDISTKVGEQVCNFQKLPANGEIADVGNNVVVATNRDAINSEVSAMKKISEDVIASIDRHRVILQGCDEILNILNPEIAEKQKQEEETKALRNEVAELKQMMVKFLNENSKSTQKKS